MTEHIEGVEYLRGDIYENNDGVRAVLCIPLVPGERSRDLVKYSHCAILYVGDQEVARLRPRHSEMDSDEVDDELEAGKNGHAMLEALHFYRTGKQSKRHK